MMYVYLIGQIFPYFLNFPQIFSPFYSLLWMLVSICQFKIIEFRIWLEFIYIYTLVWAEWANSQCWVHKLCVSMLLSTVIFCYRINVLFLKKKLSGQMTELYSTWNLFSWIFRNVILSFTNNDIFAFVFLYIISFYDLNFFICKMVIKIVLMMKRRDKSHRTNNTLSLHMVNPLWRLYCMLYSCSWYCWC